MPDSSDRQWFVARFSGTRGNVLGPFPAARVVDALAAGSLLPTDLARPAEVEEWKPIGSWPQFDTGDDKTVVNAPERPVVKDDFELVPGGFVRARKEMDSGASVGAVPISIPKPPPRFSTPAASPRLSASAPTPAPVAAAPLPGPSSRGASPVVIGRTRLIAAGILGLAITAALVVVLAVALARSGVVGASSPGDGMTASALGPSPPPPPPVLPMLPAPYAGVRLGMTMEELLVMYPPREDVSSCRPILLGRATEATTPPVPGSESTPEAAHSECADVAGIGGMTNDEIMRELRAAVAIAGTDRDDYQVGDLLGGLMLSLAQIRGAARAGLVSDQVVHEANGSEAVPAHEAAFLLAAALGGGTIDFTTGRAQARFLALVMRDDCSGIEPSLAREFVEGAFGRGEIARRSDAAARRCGYDILRAQDRLAGELFATTGGLAGVGLARGMSGAEAVTPESPASFREFQRRSELEATEAAFAVRVAAALPAAETYWAGAIQISPASTDGAVWGSAIVWLAGNRVTRVLVNVRDEARIADLDDTIARYRGAPGVVADAVTSWALAEGVLRLDVGAALALVLESGNAT